MYMYIGIGIGIWCIWYCICISGCLDVWMSVCMHAYMYIYIEVDMYIDMFRTQLVQTNDPTVIDHKLWWILRSKPLQLVKELRFADHLLQPVPPEHWGRPSTASPRIRKPEKRWKREDASLFGAPSQELSCKSWWSNMSKLRAPNIWPLSRSFWYPYTPIPTAPSLRLSQKDWHCLADKMSSPFRSQLFNHQSRANRPIIQRQFWTSNDQIFWGEIAGWPVPNGPNGPNGPKKWSRHL